MFSRQSSSGQPLREWQALLDKVIKTRTLGHDLQDKVSKTTFFVERLQDNLFKICPQHNIFRTSERLKDKFFGKTSAGQCLQGKLFGTTSSGQCLQDNVFRTWSLGKCLQNKLLGTRSSGHAPSGADCLMTWSRICTTYQIKTSSVWSMDHKWYLKTSEEVNVDMTQEVLVRETTHFQRETCDVKFPKGHRCCTRRYHLSV